MTEPSFYIFMATTTVAGLVILTAAGLTGWRGWLALKQQELRVAQGNDPLASATSNAGARIEIADLKERIRKLEAIAAGVDL